MDATNTTIKRISNVIRKYKEVPVFIELILNNFTDWQGDGS